MPVGIYRITETKAPAGHYSSGKEIVFEVNKAQHNDNIHYLSFRDYVENAITAVHVKLVDDMTGNELAGASPVSYTHLDVYKRQSGHWRIR